MSCNTCEPSDESELENSVQIEIQECGTFIEDQVFSKAKFAIPPGWLTNFCSCSETPSPEDIEAKMDNVHFYNDKIEIVINLAGYQPQDIKCNVVSDKIEVIAQQQENAEASSEGVIERTLSMNRSYELPQKINIAAVKCYLSSDGILLISAPWTS